MSILVTGGAGFIGSNFVLDWLAQSDEPVINLDKLTYAGNLENLVSLKGDPRHIFVQGDICDRPLIDQLLNQHRPRALVHFAAESHVDRSIHGPGDFMRTNIDGTFTLLEASRGYWQALDEHKRTQFRFHHVSTDEVYGSLGAEGLFTETTAYDPRSPYSASKASSDHLVRAYHHTYGLNVVISNCSNNYGPNQFPEKLIPLCINNIRHNRPLPVYGKGENIRDWLYVEDHAAAIDLIFHKGISGETYNIGGNNERQNIDIVKTLCRIMDTQLSRAEGTSEQLITYVKDRAGHDFRYAIDASKLRRELGWEPNIKFDEGFEKTVIWYLENEAWLNDVTSGNYTKYYDLMYLER